MSGEADLGAENRESFKGQTAGGAYFTLIDPLAGGRALLHFRKKHNTFVSVIFSLEYQYIINITSRFCVS